VRQRNVASLAGLGDLGRQQQHALIPLHVAPADLQQFANARAGFERGRDERLQQRRGRVFKQALLLVAFEQTSA
jgi:hypothetical protein